MARSGYELLAGLICESPYLKIEDHPVVRRLLVGLRVPLDPGVINDLLARQGELEADALFLFTRYQGLLQHQEHELSEYRAEKLVDIGSISDDGYKMSPKDKENKLLADDVQYAARMDRVEKLGLLVAALKSILSMVSQRNGRLDQLSNNYRRELKTDRPVGGF